MNQRRNQRIPLVLAGELTGASGESHFIETRDVSLSGAWLDHLPLSTEVGKPCVLTLFIDDDEGQSAVTFRGRIAFTDGEGCGVQFLGVDDQDFDVFAQHMVKHAPDPDALWGELEQGFVPEMETWESL